MPTYTCTINDRYRQAVLALAPTNYWPLTETTGTTANDLGSGNDDGTIGGTPTLGTAVGHGGTGVTFDGTDDEVTIATAPASTTTFTVALVFKPDTSGGSFDQGLLWNDSATSGLLFRPSTNLIQIYNATTAAGATTTTLSNATEYHIVLTSTAGVGQWYVNGAIDGASFSGVGSWTATGISVSGRRYKGVLSDVAHWSGVALTSGQVTALYAARYASLKAGSLSFTRVANGPGSLSAIVQSPDGTFRPSFGSEIKVYQDSTAIFGGNILSPRERGHNGQTGTAIETSIEAACFFGYADRRFATEEIVAGTTKAALQELDDYLAIYGVTLDGSQVNGPSLDALSYDKRSVREALQEIARLSGYVVEIDATKTLRAFDPATTSAPYNVAEGDLTLVGDVTVDPPPVEYANRVYLSFGSNGIVTKTETFTGDGSSTDFELGYTYVGHTRGVVNVNGVDETFGTGATWDYDATTNTIERTSAVTNGHVITFVYNAQFPSIAQVDDSGEQTDVGLWERWAPSEPAVFDLDVAESLAQAELDLRVARPRLVRYRTRRTDVIKPGMSQTVTLPLRDVSGTWTISEVRAMAVGNLRIEYEVTAVEGTAFAGTWRDRRRGGATTPIVTPTPEPIVGEPGPQGATGASGSNGTNGFSVLSGAGAPGGGTGVNGDFYINTSTYDIYGPKTAGAWGSPTSLIGPPGDPPVGAFTGTITDGSFVSFDVEDGWITDVTL
jgi:hypothetical protein